MEHRRNVALDRKGKQLVVDDVDGSSSGRYDNDLQFIPYSKLKEATNDFAKSNILTSSYLSIVYKGKLPSTNQMVAIKQFRSPSSSLYPSTFDDDLDEAIENERREHLNSVNQHPNIITLVGYCIEEEDDFDRTYFVYDYMRLKSLDSHIYGFWGKTLSWNKRIRILLGIANVLCHLHDKKLCHLKLKLSNIFLDENYIPKLSEFLFVEEINDLGFYQYKELKQIKRVTDIRDFGMVALKILTGKRSTWWDYRGRKQQLCYWAKNKYLDGKIEEMVDPKLRGKYCRRLMEHAFAIAIDCTRELPFSRPEVKMVVNWMTNINIRNKLCHTTLSRREEKVVVNSMTNISIANNMLGPTKVTQIQQFTHQQLIDATQNFTLGCLRFGSSRKVFRGMFGDEKNVAVKVFHNVDLNDRAKYDGYPTEFQMMQNVQHDNIVRLVGFCNEDGRRCLVYEEILGWTLGKWILGLNKSMEVTFRVRLQIMLGVCEALVHLHSLKHPIVHRDINASNILVTHETFFPKLTGFSIARELVREDKHREEDIPDFPMFKDPVYTKSGFSTLTNDVFSFGLVIIQTITGRTYMTQSSLIKWVKEVTYGDLCKLADHKLRGDYPMKEMWDAFILGKQCIDEMVGVRPTMIFVRRRLNQILSRTFEWEEMKREEERDRDEEESQKEQKEKMKHDKRKEKGNLIAKFKGLFK